MSDNILFTPFTLKGLSLPSRIVMAPMTRNMAEGGIPGTAHAAYYRRRAEGKGDTCPSPADPRLPT